MATMTTMASDPFVNHVPVMSGGVGSSEVRHFYGTYVIPGHPPDTESVRVARTVGEYRIVDELIHKFTHTIDMPWILSGVAPTGRRVEQTNHAGKPITTMIIGDPETRITFLVTLVSDSP